MMKTIIDNKAKEHHIQNYKFKILSSFDTDTSEEQLSEVIETPQEIKEEPVIIKEITPPPPPPPNPINEEMLKKMETLSDNVVKLQMKLEKQEEEFEKRLLNEIEIAKKNAYEEGLNAGKSQNEDKINELSINVSNSIKKLENKCQELSDFCEKTKSDLNEAAYLIAKEVVNKELETSSAKIALAYANTIMQGIDKSIKIKISVNPKDFDYLNKELSSNRIEILADDAINKGCLIINSDTLNTQINLKERLAQARSMILDEA
ncbi:MULTISPECIES: FliH/SctL family protein [unclassified Campylobacter]|uniref:FliH/SctL family protein n=2 Tax=unclassified Campylobacter TaxID=2593542 RepID=UPI001BDA1C0A|nr:FliH/SctL family protein [Campylobacter sp. 2018MI10]MBT0880922.1 hypothetical protein [Campylobacter sp. 2018MI27]MBZ7975355.1 hypothetical protein [Campylobacter sp. RM12637]MBZ7977190.1 hypothetical protein [Campylobacter sp. RM12654]MBZ7981702.1 hypothetical protein [Campylobacter sp. RM12640]MBZ7988581.1 hypothetical protein [Campylobacter sp. RM12635]